MSEQPRHPDHELHVMALVRAFRADDVDAITAALLAFPRPHGGLMLRDALARRKAEDAAAAAVPRIPAP
jgi:hypothetical protein